MSADKKRPTLKLGDAIRMAVENPEFAQKLIERPERYKEQFDLSQRHIDALHQLDAKELRNLPIEIKEPQSFAETTLVVEEMLLAKNFAPPTPEEAAARKASMPEGSVPYWEKPPTFDEAYAGRMMIIGDPDDCIRQVNDYEKAGVTMIQGAFQLGGMPHDMVMDSIKLFGDEVIPNLA